jgi:hypothetical protein
MPWPKALNQQSAITCWTAEAKSKRYDNALTDEENGKRNGNKPRPPKKPEQRSRPLEELRANNSTRR